jgi:hypothetical protein
MVLENDRQCEQFIRLCGDQVPERGEILLDIGETLPCALDSL